MPTTGTKPELPADAGFGAWVRTQREGRGWTQRVLAERLGCVERMLRYIEAGTRQPSPQMVDLLLGAFEVPKDQRAAYTTWAEGGPAPEREAGLAPLLQRVLDAVEAKLAADQGPLPPEEIARLTAAVQGVVEAAFAAHPAPDAATLATAVVQELRAEFAALQARQAVQLREQLAATLAPVLAEAQIAAQEAGEQRREARAWRRGFVAWYRVHVKEQVAAAALIAVLLHGVPVPFADTMLQVLVIVLVWATLGVCQYWWPPRVVGSHERPALLLEVGRRALAWPAATLAGVWLVLIVRG